MYYLHPPCWLFCFHLFTNEPLWCSRAGRRCWMVFWRAERSLQSTDESPAAHSAAECPTSLCLHYHSKHPKNMKTSFISMSLPFKCLRSVSFRSLLCMEDRFCHGINKVVAAFSSQIFCKKCQNYKKKLELRDKILRRK